MTPLTFGGVISWCFCLFSTFPMYGAVFFHYTFKFLIIKKKLRQLFYIRLKTSCRNLKDLFMSTFIRVWCWQFSGRNLLSKSFLGSNLVPRYLLQRFHYGNIFGLYGYYICYLGLRKVLPIKWVWVF